MNIERLYDILGLKRGHNSDGEQIMIRSMLLTRDNCLQWTNPTTDEVLAYVISVGESKTLFTAHTDTVHGRTWSKGSVVASPGPGITNEFTVDSKNIIHAEGDVLGADDGAGVWLLLEMIDAGKPGVYLFPRGEEKGGIGSSGLAKIAPTWLSQFDRCVSFDRRGTSSVITHQGFTRCCSDKFAAALAAELMGESDKYFFMPDDTGVFTDSKNFTDQIGECTNVSVGYDKEHTDKESLDLEYLFFLRGRCLAIDWEALPTSREPGEVDPADSYGVGGWYSHYRTGSSGTGRRGRVSYYAMTTEELIEYLYTEMPTMEELEDIMFDLSAANTAELVAALMWQDYGVFEDDADPVGAPMTDE